MAHGINYDTLTYSGLSYEQLNMMQLQAQVEAYRAQQRMYYQDIESGQIKQVGTQEAVAPKKENTKLRNLIAYYYSRR